MMTAACIIRVSFLGWNVQYSIIRAGAEVRSAVMKSSLESFLELNSSS
jgi:hypothetical protein